MAKHNLKIKSEYFVSIINGNKTAEIRYNDHNYQVGDILVLNEIDEEGNLTGSYCEVGVTNILDNAEYLQDGYVMLSFKSSKDINRIKAQGIEEAVKKADKETYICLVGQEFPPQQQYRAELLAHAEHLRER